MKKDPTVSVFSLIPFASCSWRSKIRVWRARQAFSLKRINNNYVAWIEGAAIFVAVFLVASIGSFVDYKKEVQFVKSRLKSEEKNVVSKLFSCDSYFIFFTVTDVLFERD